MGLSAAVSKGLRGPLAGSRCRRRRCATRRCCWGTLRGLRGNQQAQPIQPALHIGQALPLGRLSGLHGGDFGVQALQLALDALQQLQQRLIHRERRQRMPRPVIGAGSPATSLAAVLWWLPCCR